MRTWIETGLSLRERGELSVSRPLTKPWIETCPGKGMRWNRSFALTELRGLEPQIGYLQDAPELRAHAGRVDCETFT